MIGILTKNSEMAEQLEDYVRPKTLDSSTTCLVTLVGVGWRGCGGYDLAIFGSDRRCVYAVSSSTKHLVPQSIGTVSSCASKRAQVSPP